jgi:hypothetical protein
MLCPKGGPLKAHEIRTQLCQHQHLASRSLPILTPDSHTVVDTDIVVTPGAHYQSLSLPSQPITISNRHKWKEGARVNHYSGDVGTPAKRRRTPHNKLRSAAVSRSHKHPSISLPTKITPAARLGRTSGADHRR